MLYPTSLHSLFSWDIPALEAGDGATWPENPPKCFYDEHGDCITLGEILEDTEREFGDYEDIPQWMFETGDFAAMDIFMNRSQVLETARRHSLGATTHLDWDEYPLEIQCNRCFWQVMLSHPTAVLSPNPTT